MSLYMDMDDGTIFQYSILRCLINTIYMGQNDKGRHLFVDIDDTSSIPIDVDVDVDVDADNDDDDDNTVHTF